MIEIISGEREDKRLLTKVNAAVASASGSIVYLDKSQKHMYELSNKIRLINVTDYPIDIVMSSSDLSCGIVSQIMIWKNVSGQLSYDRFRRDG